MLGKWTNRCYFKPMLWLRFSFVCLTTLISLILLELSDPSVLVTEAGWWAIAALLIGYVVAIEGKQLASLGLQKPSKSTITTAAAGLGLALCGVAAFGIITAFIGLETNSTEERLDQTAAAPIWWLIIVFCGRVSSKSYFFRGFVISRSIELGVSPTIAVIGATALFVLPHAFFWPGPSLILISLTGLAMGTIFVWKRDLIACMLAHIGVNVGGVIAVLLH